MPTYDIRGFKNGTPGGIVDAGPFEVYVDSIIPGNRLNAAQSNVNGDVIDEYTLTTLFETISVDGVDYDDVVSKDNLNGGLRITLDTAPTSIIFKSVSHCTNFATFIPPSATPSVTPSKTPSASVTPSRTPSVSVTPSVTGTPGASPSRTPSISISPSLTPSKSISATPSPSLTPSISVSKTPSASVTPSITVSRSPGASPTRTPSNTPPISRTPSKSVSRTPSTSVSRTPSVSVTPSPSKTPSISITPSITPSRTPSKSVTPSRSDLNLTSWYADGFSTSSGNDACTGTGGGTFYHDGSGSDPVAGDRIYSTAQGGAVLGGYYYISLNETFLVVNSSGYVQTTGQCCFVEGTMISINGSESVAIETLAVGDTVHSKHIPTIVDSDDVYTLTTWSNPSIAGTASTASIVTIKELVESEVYNINNGLFKCTESHLHIIKRDQVWTIRQTHDLVVGDIFEDINGNEVAITSIAKEAYDGMVYQLNVETDDVYYANGILTHNIK